MDNYIILRCNLCYIYLFYSKFLIFKFNVINQFLCFFTKYIFYMFFVLKRYFSFSGKIFRLKVFKHNLKFLFNRSHRTFLYLSSNFIKLKKKLKKKIKLSFFLNTDIGLFYSILNFIRRLNIFTWRGLKFSKKHYNKKQGKISSYRRGISY